MAETKGPGRALVAALAICAVISALAIGGFAYAYGVDELKTLDPVHDGVVDRQIDLSDTIVDELKTI